MKTCKKCGEVKPLDEFYRNKGCADGHVGSCIKCDLQRKKDHRKANPDAYRERDNLPHRVLARKNYAATERGRERQREAMRSFMERNPEKYAAYIAVSNAVRDGRIWKSPCCMADDCYETERLQGHHPDYDNHLSVVWLCPAHHNQLHKEFDAQHRAA